mgnify:CR=1 FL=1
MANRKLGRPTDQRMAMLRNQVTNLIWYGKIETTLARGKEVQSLAEHLVTIAMRQCDNTIEVTKKHMNDKKQVEELTVQNDSPARLAARRQIMRYLYDIPAVQNEGEDKDDFKKRQPVSPAVPTARAVTTIPTAMLPILRRNKQWKRPSLPVASPLTLPLRLP